MAPFGFKGAYLHELWQTRVVLAGEGGRKASGSGTQSVLWSDPEVFTVCPEAVGNAEMLLTTAEAARFATGVEWDNLIELQETMLDGGRPQACGRVDRARGRPPSDIHSQRDGRLGQRGMAADGEGEGVEIVRRNTARTDEGSAREP